MMHGIFEEFKVVMQWERKHFEELGGTAPGNKPAANATRSTSSSR
jgi:hypothetical protein